MIGTRLGSYRIDRELGAGGMGKVYAGTLVDRAPGLESGATVALKVVHPHLLESPGFFMRFMREAQLGASIRHENVVRTHHCDQVFAHGRPHAFLVMEHVEGQNLRALLQEMQRVPEELCRHIGREIAKGLIAVHAAGVVHRDLKPENAVITGEQVVKIMDLGVAQLADEGMRLSHSGAFVGSVEYASPEQFAEGGDVDHRCDLHALGLLLYELASGQHPYRGDDFRGVMRRICETEPRRVGDINPQLSPFLEEVVHTLLRKDRDQRFADAALLLSVLEEGEDSEWWHERARALRTETSRPLRRIRIPRETAVYGREPEIERLRNLYERAVGGDGQVVLIEGEAGIGKSRLVDELVARLQSDGEDLSFLFGSYPPSGAATASGAFSAAFREHLGEAGSASYLTQTPVLVPAFDALLKGESAPTGVELLTKDSLQACFGNVTRSLAAERPTIVLIDDLHFAPDEGRALFTALATLVPGNRVLLVGTTRPGVSEDWMAGLTRLAHTSHVSVGRLGPKDLAELLQDCLKSEQLAHSLGVQIGLKSDGNPFFAFEIIRGLREGQFLTQSADGTWASTQVIGEIQIPSSVLDLVNARVADLDEEERDLLDVASCWGFEFDPGLIGEVVGLGRIPALKRFGQIERKHRLLRASGRLMVFDHHQVQEALYGRLLEQLREEYHGALAETLESRTRAAETDPTELDGALCVDLCEHFLRGARGRDAKRYLDAALDHLERGHLPAVAMSLADRALALPGAYTGADRADLLWRLNREGGPAEFARPAEEQISALEEYLRLVDPERDGRGRARALMMLGFRIQGGPRHGEAQGILDESLALARSVGDLETEAFVSGNLGHLQLASGRLEEALALHERQRVLGIEAGSAMAIGNAQANKSSVLMKLARAQEALESADAAIATHHAAGNRGGEIGGHWNRGLILVSLGRPDEARAAIERHLAIAQEIGDRRREAAAITNLGYLASRAGRHRDARRLYERGAALGRELRDASLEVLNTMNLAGLDATEGLLVEARERLEWCLAAAREAHDRRGERLVVHLLGEVLAEQVDDVEADAHLVECVRLAEESGDGALAAAAQLSLGSLLAERDRAAGGSGEPGREALEAARGRVAADAGQKSAALVDLAARCELARLPGGDAAEVRAALAEFEAAHGPPDTIGAHFSLWQATGDAAQLEAAKRLLDEELSKADPEARPSMRTNRRLYREVLAAWREHPGVGDDPPDDAGPARGTESITRVG